MVFVKRIDSEENLRNCSICKSWKRHYILDQGFKPKICSNKTCYRHVTKYILVSQRHFMPEQKYVIALCDICAEDPDYKHVLAPKLCSTEHQHTCKEKKSRMCSLI
jgi:hypothetical protein